MSDNEHEAAYLAATEAYALAVAAQRRAIRERAKAEAALEAASSACVRATEAKDKAHQVMVTQLNNIVSKVTDD